jgi:hypothetical protein
LEVFECCIFFIDFLVETKLLATCSMLEEGHGSMTNLSLTIQYLV